VTDQGLRAIAAGCPQLQVLCANDCMAAGFAMEAIARGCPRLRVLDANQTFLPAAAVLALAECCPLLTHVSVVCCEEIGDGEITALVRGCPALWKLDIPGTSVTQQGLWEIREHCKNLKYIGLEEHMLPEGCHESDFFPPGVRVRLTEVVSDGSSSDEEWDYNSSEESDYDDSEESKSSSYAGDFVSPTESAGFLPPL
jgi:hypothetical protein